MSAIVKGTVARDPELRYTPSGYALATWSVFPEGGVEPVRCVAWRELGERLCEQLRQGTLVNLWGYEKTREWDGKTTTEFVVTRADYREPA